MELREFRLKMSCAHRGDENEIAELQLQMFLDEAWTPVEVTMQGSSPYRVFLFAVFLCENSYLYMNASERGLLLGRTTGEIHYKTSDFKIDEITAEFTSTVRRGSATEDDAQHICERMMACPVSRNMSARKQITLNLAEHRVVLEH